MKMRKALAIILTAIMVCTIAPAQVFAEEGTVFAEDVGEGGGAEGRSVGRRDPIG